jgi:hypothetical protein
MAGRHMPTASGFNHRLGDGFVMQMAFAASVTAEVRIMVKREKDFVCRAPYL